VLNVIKLLCMRVALSATVQVNFYEKALFVKVDVAAAFWLTQLLLCALRAMLLCALSGSSHSFWWLGALWDPSRFGLKALQSSERPSSWRVGQVHMAQSPLEIRSAFGQGQPWPSTTLASLVL
jgi:hypothetical protein